MEIENSVFGPRKIKLIDIWINSAGGFISWLIWSVILVFIIFLFSWIIDIPQNFESINIWPDWNSSSPPFILSSIAFVVWIIVCTISYYFLTITDSQKYKKTRIHFWQITFFAILMYIFFTPIYIYVWIRDYNNIMYVFMIHILLLFFWENILLELFNNYRYLIVSFYANFIWLLITWIIIFSIFLSFWNWYARLLSLLLILPLINWFLLFFKWMGEFLYYYYFKFSWQDQLWDILKQIQLEEDEEFKQAVWEWNIY